MGWFAIACILGYATYRGWRLLQPLELRTKTIVGVIAFFVLCIATVLWAIFLVEATSFGGLVEKLGQGGVARFLFGIILGFGTGYATDPYRRESGRVGRSAKDGKRAATVTQSGGSVAKATRHAAGAKDELAIAGKGLLLPIGIVIVLLAITAPHVDRWLSNLTSLKTSIVEIQLASISNTTKAVLPDTRENFIDQQILEHVLQFSLSIERDILFIEKFDLLDIRQRRQDNPRQAARLDKEEERINNQLKQLTDIRKAFDDVVSPLAECIKGAIDNGFNIESARQSLRPLADLLTQVVILEDQLPVSSQPSKETMAPLNDLRQKFWKSLTQIPATISPYLTAAPMEKCQAIKGRQIEEYPRYTDYKNLPHLFAAMSYLLMFVNNDGLALELMQKVQDGWDFDDFKAPYVRATLMYYRGDGVDRYVKLLEKMRATAQRHKEVIKRVNDRCGGSCTDEIKKWGPILTRRARIYDLLAMNIISYGVA
jgi:hypothetical protein